MPTACFLIEPTARRRYGLRRFADGPCPPENDARFSYHSALVWIGAAKRPPRQVNSRDRTEMGRFADDPRWPRRCEICGKRFRARDRWQIFTERLYRTPDGSEVTLKEAPVGAMHDASWEPDDWKNPLDGRAWTVKLPNGTWWNVDGPATGDEENPKITPHAWTRTGDPPMLTVTPSIAAGRREDPGFYHGYLTGGVLTDSL